MSSAAAAVEKTATKSKVGKKFYQTEGFHSFLLLSDNEDTLNRLTLQGIEQIIK